jgi:hypothetical protein
MPQRGSPPGVLPAVWGSILDDLDRDQAGWLRDVHAEAASGGGNLLLQPLEV